MKVGTSSQIKIKNIYNDKVKSYSSSNTNVATVSKNGEIAAVGSGNAIITIETESGRFGVYKLTVVNEIKKAIEVSKISLNT